MDIRDPSIMREASVRAHTRTDRLRSKLFRRPLVTVVLPAVLLIASACSSNTSSSSPPQAGAAAEWRQANHDLANTRNASSSTISSENVDQLGVGWTYGIEGTSAFGSLATSPLVVNATVYLQDLKSNVYAIDLRSGQLEWQKRYDADNVGPNGAGFDDGKLFVTNGMQTVVALDATSGEEIWSRRIVSVATQGITQQLTAHDGILYVSTIPGSSLSHFYEGGGMGIIHALDERTGNELWSFNTVKNGRLWGNPKVNSGGGAWYPPAVDTSNGTTYWGIGNPAPYPGTKAFPSASSRPGPNLYTDSELALNSSGELQWFQQVKPHDLFDGDFQISPILATATTGGSSRDIVIGSGKLGHVVAFDRQTGEELWDTPVGLHRNDDLTTIPAGKTVTVAPGVYGGVETPMALADGVVFVPVVNVPTDYTASSSTQPDVSGGTGELYAIDVSTGTILWTAKLDAPDFGGALVAGDLVFTSTFAGEVVAFDRASGKQVWSMQAPGGINSPMSAAGDTLLVPVGLGTRPMLLALELGATGTIPSASPSVTPTSAPSPSPSGNTDLQISSPDQGDGILFDTSQLTAPAGARVSLTYTNETSIPHDWHLFDGANASSPSIVSTKIQAGPNDAQNVSFTVPSKPGRYYFQCDVHPTLMNGFLIVH
jgi:outer membrane protein assembly factor BamB/plastocyanin